MEEKNITIYSYTKVWKIEKKIYNIGNLVLPVPVDLWNAIYYLFAFLVVCMLQKAFPVITVIPAILRLGMIPYGIMYIVRKKKLDGKNPVQYFIGLAGYIWGSNSYIERFDQHPAGKEKLILDWSCSEGCRPEDKMHKKRGKKHV